MVRIAICEDDVQEAKTMMDYLAVPHYAGLEYHVDVFHYGKYLLSEYTDECRPFDVVLLDIELPDIDGFHVAESIRRFDRDVKIIFTTVHDELDYALGGYQYGAADYIVKPVTMDKLGKTLRSSIKNLRSERENRITHRQKNGLISIPTSEILYLQVHDHLLDIHTANKTYQIRKGLKKAVQECGSSMLFISNYCAINKYHYRTFDPQNRTVTMKHGETLDISKRKFRDVVRALMELGGGHAD